MVRPPETFISGATTHKSAYLDDDMGPLGRGGRLEAGTSLLRNEDDPAVLFVPSSVLLALVQDAKVVRLGNADKLAVVALGSHHPPVVQLVHCRRDAETAKERKGK